MASSSSSLGAYARPPYNPNPRRALPRIVNNPGETLDAFTIALGQCEEEEQAEDAPTTGIACADGATGGLSPPRPGHAGSSFPPAALRRPSAKRKKCLEPMEVAQIRLAIGKELNLMIQKTPSGSFNPSEALIAKLGTIGGTRANWKAEYATMKESRTKAALMKMGSISSAFTHYFALEVIDAIVGSDSLLARGQPELAVLISKLRDVNAFVLYVYALVIEYADLVDDSIAALAKQSAMVPKGLAQRTIELHQAWIRRVGLKIDTGVADFAEMTAAPFAHKYVGPLVPETVVTFTLRAIQVEVQEKLAIFLREKRAIPIISQPDEQATFTVSELETAYYITCAVAFRTLKHFKRLARGGNSSAAVAQAIAFLQFNIVSEDVAASSCGGTLPIGLVLQRRRVKLIFVSPELFSLFNSVERLYLPNSTLKHLEGHGADLFAKLHKVVIGSSVVQKLFRKAAPRAPSMLEATPGGDPEDALGDCGYFYADLFSAMMKKYRKIKQADVLKALKRWKFNESEALRRKLKTVGSATTKEARAAKRQASAALKSKKANANEQEKKEKQNRAALLDAKARFEAIRAPLLTTIGNAAWTVPLLVRLLKWRGESPSLRLENEEAAAFKKRLSEELSKACTAAEILRAANALSPVVAAAADAKEAERSADEDTCSSSDSESEEEEPAVQRGEGTTDVASDTESDSSDSDSGSD